MGVALYALILGAALNSEKKTINFSFHIYFDIYGDYPCMHTSSEQSSNFETSNESVKTGSFFILILNFTNIYVIIVTVLPINT